MFLRIHDGIQILCACFLLMDIDDFPTFSLPKTRKHGAIGIIPGKYGQKQFGLDIRSNISYCKSI